MQKISATLAVAVMAMLATGCSSSSALDDALQRCIEFGNQAAAASSLSEQEIQEISETVCGRLLEEDGEQAFIDQWKDL